MTTTLDAITAEKSALAPAPCSQPAHPARDAHRPDAQWYYDLREPLQRYVATRLPLYRRRGQAGNYVLVWPEGGTIHERFFPDTVSLYGWMVRPENKHLCGPQSIEQYITDY